MWFNNWPRIKQEKYQGRAAQILKIQDEINEAVEALSESQERYKEELFDIAHAVDTLIQQETVESERDYWQEFVIAKNNERGYYEPRR